MDNAELSKQLDKLMKRIPYNSDVFETDYEYMNFLETLYEDATNIALSILYPFEDYSQIQLPAKYYNWVLRCCVELYNLNGSQGISSYSENGMSWSRQSDGISKRLYNELIPKASAPKKKEVSEVTENV